MRRILREARVAGQDIQEKIELFGPEAIVDI